MGDARSHDRCVAADGHDPRLSAHVEGVRVLAQHVSDLVMVLGRDLTIHYANPRAIGAMRLDPRAARTKCFEAFNRSANECADCPALPVFQTGGQVSMPTAGARACGVTDVVAFEPVSVPPPFVMVVGRPAATRRPGAGIEPVSSLQERPGAAEREGLPGLGRVIGASPPMAELFDLVRSVAPSRATVLIQGESGTGKELVARTIHELSGGGARPFVVVDCGALPDTLLESELFGHVKGAFTGAVTHKEGLLEAAKGGTIFLDEIGDTSPAFQAKLLRVLQEGEVKPVGSTRSVTIHARVISATNKELAELVRAKRFREDLYYRLAVLPLTVPPLRSRRADIPLLVDCFLRAAARRHGRRAPATSEAVLERLMAAEWPGNVRQLQHVIERAVITDSNALLTVDAVFGKRTEQVSSDLPTVVRGAVRRAERVRILEALREASGNRMKAARLLGISRAGLYNKLKTYAIDEHG